uniref:Uncharacterized protein n=1 Tax=Cannabis sativa TaxID=3483 RepID=A0A803PAS1_CANSA
MYYQNLLGIAMDGRLRVNQTVVDLGPKITNLHRNIIQAEFTAQEVKEAFISILGIKSPRPDGFGSAFFQDNW